MAIADLAKFIRIEKKHPQKRGCFLYLKIIKDNKEDKQDEVNSAQCRSYNIIISFAPASHNAEKHY